MKKIFCFIFVLVLTACTQKIIVTDNIFDGKTMMNTMNGMYSVEQFDSMCVADTLSMNLNEWQFLGVKDYETNDKVYLYSTFKKNVVYKVEKSNNDSVKIMKRTVN